MQQLTMMLPASVPWLSFCCVAHFNCRFANHLFLNVLINQRELKLPSGSWRHSHDS